MTSLEPEAILMGEYIMKHGTDDHCLPIANVLEMFVNLPKKGLLENIPIETLTGFKAFVRNTILPGPIESFGVVIRRQLRNLKLSLDDLLQITCYLFKEPLRRNPFKELFDRTHLNLCVWYYFHTFGNNETGLHLKQLPVLLNHLRNHLFERQEKGKFIDRFEDCIKELERAIDMMGSDEARNYAVWREDIHEIIYFAFETPGAENPIDKILKFAHVAKDVRDYVAAVAGDENGSVNANCLYFMLEKLPSVKSYLCGEVPEFKQDKIVIMVNHKEIMLYFKHLKAPCKGKSDFEKYEAVLNLRDDADEEIARIVTQLASIYKENPSVHASTALDQILASTKLVDDNISPAVDTELVSSDGTSTANTPTLKNEIILSAKKFQMRGDMEIFSTPEIKFPLKYPVPTLQFPVSIYQKRCFGAVRSSYKEQAREYIGRDEEEEKEDALRRIRKTEEESAQRAKIQKLRNEVRDLKDHLANAESWSYGISTIWEEANETVAAYKKKWESEVHKREQQRCLIEELNEKLQQSETEVSFYNQKLKQQKIINHETSKERDAIFDKYQNEVELNTLLDKRCKNTESKLGEMKKQLSETQLALRNLQAVEQEWHTSKEQCAELLEKNRLLEIDMKTFEDEISSAELKHLKIEDALRSHIYKTESEMISLKCELDLCKSELDLKKPVTVLEPTRIHVENTVLNAKEKFLRSRCQKTKAKSPFSHMLPTPPPESIGLEEPGLSSPSPAEKVFINNRGAEKSKKSENIFQTGTDSFEDMVVDMKKSVALLENGLSPFLNRPAACNPDERAYILEVLSHISHIRSMSTKACLNNTSFEIADHLEGCSADEACTKIGRSRQQYMPFDHQANHLNLIENSQVSMIPSLIMADSPINTFKIGNSSTPIRRGRSITCYRRSLQEPEVETPRRALSCIRDEARMARFKGNISITDGEFLLHSFSSRPTNDSPAPSTCTSFNKYAASSDAHIKRISHSEPIVRQMKVDISPKKTKGIRCSIMCSVIATLLIAVLILLTVLVFSSLVRKKSIFISKRRTDFDASLDFAMQYMQNQVQNFMSGLCSVDKSHTWYDRPSHLCSQMAWLNRSLSVTSILPDSNCDIHVPF